MNSSTKPTEVTDVINFHGLTMLVVTVDGTEYIYAKPLSDLAGLHWRTQKRTLLEDENAVLYGSRLLKPPVFVAEGGASTTPPDAVYIRLDRARMFLARINTRHMKAQGNVDAAEALLELQVEWAYALHDYETKGEARKNTVRDAVRKDQQMLATMLKVRSCVEDKKERQAVTEIVHQMLRDLGHPVQTELDIES